MRWSHSETTRKLGIDTLTHWEGVEVICAMLYIKLVSYEFCHKEKLLMFIVFVFCNSFYFETFLQVFL